MKTKSAMLQRMIKENALQLSVWYEIYNCQRVGRKNFVEEKDWEAVKTFTKVINKNRERLVKLEENQRFLKAELKEAYYEENFEKSYQHLGSFTLLGMPPEMSFSDAMNLIGDEE